MLAGINFDQRVSKKKTKKQMPILKEQIYCLQKTSWDANLPVIVLLEGWDTIRRQSLIRTLTEPLDPRGFVFHAIRSPLAHEKARPWMWRFWLKIPERGQWAIFDQSWYRRVLRERHQENISERDLRRALRDINDFERTLSDDGTLILKFFLHTEKSQYKMHTGSEARQADTSSAEFSDSKTLSRRYDHLLDIYESVLRHTQQDWAPWIIIPADDKRTARYMLLKIIIKKIQHHLGISVEPQQAESAQASPASKPRATKKTKATPIPISTPDPDTSAPSPAEVVQQQASKDLEPGKDFPQTEVEISEKSPAEIQQSLPDELQGPDENKPDSAPVTSGDELP